MTQVYSPPLTAREVQILDYVSHGLTDQRIAERLFVSRSTVMWYMKNLRMKLSARDRAHAVRKGFELGYLAPSQGE